MRVYASARSFLHVYESLLVRMVMSVVRASALRNLPVSL
jgi:hypothetical protein